MARATEQRPSRRIALFIAAHWALVMGAAIILHRRDGDHWLVSLTGVGAISLAFLAPELVEAAVQGRLPRGLGLTRLANPPVDWTAQRRLLGI